MFSELSLELTKSIGKPDKQKNGIYFTPIGTVNKTLQYLEPYMENVKNILEPSCGSGEYINGLTSLYSDLELDCIELYKPIYDLIKSFEKTIKDSKISIHNEDYLTSRTIEGKKYDLIIGNPPFYVMKKTDVERKYWDYFDGRPNI